MKPWHARDKALLYVSHTTRLSNAERCVEAHGEIRMSPVDTGLQRVVSHLLDVYPAADLDTYTDGFGSHVHHLSRLETRGELVIQAESVVETTDAVCCGPVEPPGAPASRRRLAEYLQWSPSVQPLDAYREIEHPVRLDLSPEAFVVALEELAAAVQSRFRRDANATDANPGPGVDSGAGDGVTRDLTHATIGVLRFARVPSRCVSGYVYDPAGDEEGDRLQGAGACHAWVQAWHAELGWVGIDPTNGRLVDWQYVRVTAGPDYDEAQPLRGFFVGPRVDELDLEVSVKRIG